MFGYIFCRDKNVTSFYRLGFWYDRHYRNGKETNWLKKTDSEVNNG